jgi:selenide,water dikinase
LNPAAPDPNLLVGTDTFDDAGVYRLRDDLALVQTVDFFPPLVDDPATFGRIAAANALSDVYAMNGQPLTALNLVAFPENELPLEVLGAILGGAAERVAAAGAVTVGGHSVRGAELTFGLSVTGTVHPAELLTNSGARPGDVLVLTKPLGTGFITTAAKKERCPAATLEAAVASMVQLNAVGRDALRASGGAHGLTDITGFGLLGHAAELADGSGVTIELESGALPAIEGVRDLAGPTFHTRASKTNRAYVEGRSRIEPDADPIGVELAFDAQTSGGLLISVDPDHLDRLLAGLAERGAAAAAVVGRVRKRDGSLAVVLS